MNLMFWKKKAEISSDTGNTQAEPADKTAMRASAGHESPDAKPSDAEIHDDEISAKPGLLARITAQFVALARRFKRPPAFSAAEDHAADASSPSESAPEDELPARPTNLKKRLIVGGVISLLVLLLGGIVFAMLKIFVPAHKQNADVPAIAETPRLVTHAGISQAEVDALKKKNLELQVQIEALKKEPPKQEPSRQEPSPPQLSVESVSQQASGNVTSPSESGDITVGNQDPQAAAMSLKEAIKAMNEGNGDYTRKNAK